MSEFKENWFKTKLAVHSSHDGKAIQVRRRIPTIDSPTPTLLPAILNLRSDNGWQVVFSNNTAESLMTFAQWRWADNSTVDPELPCEKSPKGSIVQESCEEIETLKVPKTGLNQTSFIEDNHNQFEKDCSRPVEKTQTSAQWDGKGLPPLGYRFKFAHEFTEKFKHLSGEQIGWENGDQLQVVYCSYDDSSEVHLVLVANVEDDVLSSYSFTDNDVFIPPLSREEELIDEAISFCNSDYSDAHQTVMIDTVTTLIKNGWRRVGEEDKTFLAWCFDGLKASVPEELGESNRYLMANLLERLK